MSSVELTVMLARLSELVDTTYMTAEENAEVRRLLSLPILTGAQVSWLVTLYNRLYSLRT